MTETNLIHPFKVNCKQCGAPANFDIIKQSYCCPSCGSESGISEIRVREQQWRTLNRETIEESFREHPVEAHRCPSCGAQVVFGAGEISEQCDFCSTKLVSSELMDVSRMPDLIIPFFITYDEARKHLLDWGKAHQSTPEGKTLVSNIGKLQAYYLPYQVVVGPVTGEAYRDGNFRRYQCSGYLDGIAVNTSQQLDNLVLNAVEPFDWDAAKIFHPGFIAGHKVKLRDISDAKTEERVLEEVREDFLPVVEKTLQSTGVQLQVGAGKLSVRSALLPMYFIKSGRFTAALNGQTGRISAYKERKQVRFPWIIEPSVYTLLAVLILFFVYGPDFHALFVGGTLAACLFFAIFGEGRTSLIRRIIKRSGVSVASREGTQIRFEEEKEKKVKAQTPPVFYEPNEKGQMVPVRLQFYGLSRLLSVVFQVALFISLPILLALLVRMGQGGVGEPLNLIYGAAWYAFAVAVSIIYLAKGVRRDVYDHPIVHEILPNGHTRLLGDRKSRKLSIFSTFGAGQPDAYGKPIGLLRMLKELGGIGIFLIVFLVLLLIGSVAAML